MPFVTRETLKYFPINMSLEPLENQGTACPAWNSSTELSASLVLIGSLHLLALGCEKEQNCNGKEISSGGKVPEIPLVFLKKQAYIYAWLLACSYTNTQRAVLGHY